MCLYHHPLAEIVSHVWVYGGERGGLDERKVPTATGQLIFNIGPEWSEMKNIG
jgi:hypothetical protein